MIGGSRRFGSLSPTDRRLVLEAAVLLMGVWIGLRLLRFHTVRRILEYSAGPPRALHDYRPRPPGGAAGRVAWAVTAAAARLPASMTCLVKALATNAMLRRRGLASEIRFGVRERHNSPKPFEAHAWVECDGHVVMGQVDDLQEYAVMSASE